MVIFFMKKKIQSHGNLRDYTPKLVRSNFHYYLAGLIEGDGSIYVPNENRSVKGKKLYPSIQICFHLEDLPLALLIQKNLGFGSIHRKKQSHAYIFTITNLEGIHKIIELINGKLRTPKIHKFHKLIDFVDQSIMKLPADTSSIHENAWFSGFLEADACFYLRITKTKPKISFGFYLEQRMIDFSSKQDLYTIMEKLSFFLESKLKTLSRTKKEKIFSTYRIVTTSEKSNKILIEYLEKFPIFSTKYLNYQEWKKAFFSIQERKGNIKQTIEKLLPIKQSMNNKRSFYNWDHLQNFYT